MDKLQAQQALEKLSGRILNDSTYLKANKRYVEDYIEHMKARAADLKTIHKHLYAVEFLMKMMGARIDLRKATKKDIERAIATLESADGANGKEYSEEHRVRTRTIIKAFYKHLLGDDEYYPPQVAWIKTTGKRRDRMLPEDILSEKEVMNMLNAARNARDKAIIAVLFDAGIRMGELFSMRKKDIDLISDPAHITVKGKTGMRQIPIMFSVPYLAQYLNLLKDRKPDDTLMKGMGSWMNKEKEVNYAAIRKMLQVTAKKAEIGKRIYPHLFRHSRASYYANKLTEQQLKAFFGWTGDSRMASTYVHLSGRDIDNAVLQANGVRVPERTKEPELRAKVCRRCQFSNTIESVYCNRCGAPLDIGTAMKMQETEEELKKAASESFHDPNLVEEIVREYLAQQREKRKGKRKKE